MVAYLVWFFATALPGLPFRDNAGQPYQRIDVLVSSLLIEESARSWFAGFSLAAVGERMLLLTATAAYLTVASGIGMLVLLSLQLTKRLTRLEIVLFSIALGLSVLSLATLLAGMAGMLDRALFLTIVPISIATFYVVRRGIPSQSSSPHDDLLLNRRWLWLLAPLAIVTMLMGMMPPIDFDVREYHLQAPKEFFLAGRIEFVPHNVYANMPLGAEMHALFAMVVCDDWWMGALVGKSILAAMSIVTSLMLFAFGARFFSRTVGIIAAIVYLATPWVTLVSTSGLIDGAMGLYVTMAIYALALRGNNEPNDALVALAGLSVGSAIACKYPAVLFVAIPLFVWTAFSKPRFNARTLATFAITTAIMSGPWFVKNQMFAGNPTYPLLYSVFGGETRTAEKDAQWNRAHRPSSYSSADLGDCVEKVLISSEWISPVVVPLIAFALAVFVFTSPGGSSRTLPLWLAAYLGLVFALWWLFTHRIDRFLVPTLPIATLLAASGVVALRGSLARPIVIAIGLVAMVYGLLLSTSGVLGDNRFLATLAELRNDELLNDPIHRYLNDEREHVRGVLLVGDAQPFDLRVRTFYNTCFDDCLLERLVKDRSPKQIREALSFGISHVYINWDEVNRYRSPGNYGFTDFVQPQIFADLESQGILRMNPISTPNRQLFDVVEP